MYFKKVTREWHVRDKRTSSVFLVRVEAVWTVMHLDLLKRVSRGNHKKKKTSLVTHAQGY